LVSAKSPVALRGQAGRLRSHLVGCPQLDVGDVGFSLATGRAGLEYRAAVIGVGRDQLLAGLDAVVAGRPAAGVVQGRVGSGKVAFVFPGQGAQRAGMGSELYRSYPVFAEALDAVCAEFDRHLGGSLREVLFASAGSSEAVLLDRTGFTQPAVFAVEVALYRLVQSWGLQPDFLIGHSIGELVAAYVAGVFSLTDACALVAARAALMEALPAGGAMVVVAATEQEVRSSLEGFDGWLSVAAVNSPVSTVVAGAGEVLGSWISGWEARGGKTTRLNVSHAFHSALMEPMLEEFAAVARGVSFSPPRLPIISNLSGQPAAGQELISPDYWVRQVRHSVRFLDGVRFLYSAGVSRFLELGPTAALSVMVGQCLTDAHDTLAVPALRARGSETAAVMEFAARAYVHGVGLDWAAVFGAGCKRVELPTYAFERQRYWLGSSAGAGDLGAVGLAAMVHPFLGAGVSLGGGQGWLFTGRLSVETHPWLADHRVLDVVLVPGAALVEMALAAGVAAGVEGLEELVLEAPLVVPERAAVVLQLQLGVPAEDGRCRLGIYSRLETPTAQDTGAPVEWTRHGSGVLSADLPGGVLAGGVGGAGFAELTSAPWPPPDAVAVEVDTLYDRLAGAGFQYGPAFQGLRALWRRGDEGFAEVALGADQLGEVMRFGLHPALFDAALHAVIDVLGAGAEFPAGQLPLPFAWNGVSLAAAGAAALRVRVRRN